MGVPRRARNVVVVQRVVLEARYALGDGVPADGVVTECLADLLRNGATKDGADGADPLAGLGVVSVETVVERTPDDGT